MSKPTRPSADTTRKAILDAARTHFVKKGFAGTSISEIAKLADVNQSLIYHHFKNKEDLWVSVKIRAKQDYENHMQYDFDTCMGIDNARDFLTALITYRFGIFDANPDIRRMIDWQYLETAPEKLIGQTYIDELKGRLHYFQTQGEIDPSYDLDLLLTFVINAPQGFWKGYKDLETAVPKDQLSSYKAQYCQLCVDSVLSGLLK